MTVSPSFKVRKPSLLMTDLDHHIFTENLKKWSKLMTFWRFWTKKCKKGVLVFKKLLFYNVYKFFLDWWTKMSSEPSWGVMKPNSKSRFWSKKTFGRILVKLYGFFPRISLKLCQKYFLNFSSTETLLGVEELDGTGLGHLE